MTYFTQLPSPLGDITALCQDDALAGLYLNTQKHPVSGIRKDDLPLFAQLKLWLDEYFRGENPDIRQIPLSPQGTAFQMAVWDLLRKIPYGQVTTYGALASQLATQMGESRMSAQAVGGAVGKNPISILIPCHRVIGSSGSLTGYAGGLEKKTELLELEGLHIENGRVLFKQSANKEFKLEKPT